MLRNLGITFAVYGHQDGTEKVWPFDILPRAIEPERMDDDRTRPQAADSRTQPVPRRHLQRAARAQGEGRPRGVDPLGQDLSRVVRRLEAAQGRLVPRHGHRPGSRSRRPVLRAGGQPALPLGRVVRAGKPRGDETHISRRSSRACRSRPSRTIPSGCWRRCRAAPGRRHRSDGRRAHAGNLQQRVFRAFVPGPEDGRRAGPGLRPDRGRRPGDDADHARTEAGRCHLPPHRRRLSRSRMFSQRFRVWACRG